MLSSPAIQGTFDKFDVERWQRLGDEAAQSHNGKAGHHGLAWFAASVLPSLSQSSQVEPLHISMPGLSSTSTVLASKRRGTIVRKVSRMERLEGDLPERPH